MLYFTIGSIPIGASRGAVVFLFSAYTSRLRVLIVNILETKSSSRKFFRFVYLSEGELIAFNKYGNIYLPR